MVFFSKMPLAFTFSPFSGAFTFLPQTGTFCSPGAKYHNWGRKNQLENSWYLIMHEVDAVSLIPWDGSMQWAWLKRLRNGGKQQNVEYGTCKRNPRQHGQSPTALLHPLHSLHYRPHPHQSLHPDQPSLKGPHQIDRQNHHHFPHLPLLHQLLLPTVQKIN